LGLVSNGMAISCNLLMKDFARPFVSRTYANEGSNYIPIDSQHVIRARDLNSLASFKYSD
jgi:hypothetical protein